MYYSDTRYVMMTDQISTVKCICVGCEIDCGRSYPYCAQHLDIIYGLRIAPATRNGASIGFGVFATRLRHMKHEFGQCLSAPKIVIFNSLINVDFCGG